MAQQESSPFDRIGGENGVRALVDRFYEHMDTLESARGIRAMHPADLTESRNKLFEFLCGWLGGPPLYMQRRGNPMLRMRHLPFPIASPEADAWLECMRLAMDEFVSDRTVRELMESAFSRMAYHLRNKPEPAEPPA